MGRHNTSPELSKFMEKLADLLDRPVGMALYAMKDGKVGMAAVQGGPKGEGGLDDATGASGAAGGASYKQTSATVDLSECCGWVMSARMERVLSCLQCGVVQRWCGASLSMDAARSDAYSLLFDHLSAANIEEDDADVEVWGLKLKLPWFGKKKKE